MNYDLVVRFIPYVFPGICCTFLLSIYILADKTFNKLISISFLISVVCAFLLVIGDAVDYYLEIEHEYYQIRQLVGSLNYIWRISCVGYLVRVAQRKMSPHIFTIHILVLLNAIFAVANIWTGWIFRVNADHSFDYGVFLYLPYIVIGYFIIFFVHSTVKYFRTNMAESISIIAICAICLFANIIEMVLHIKIVLGQAFSISSFLYYLCLTTELYKRDALTDVYNRRSFYLCAKRWKSRRFGVIMLDLNDLKKFNDMEGHKAGDLALITSVNCMQKIFKKYGVVYRLGGDEFAIIIKDNYISKIDSLLNAFDGQIMTTKYRMAYGYAIYNPSKKFDSVLEEADARMYRNKQVMKNCEPR